MTDRCEVCRGAFVRDDNNYWSDCVPCERMSVAYERGSKTAGDPDYALHELAHHVVLFRCLPKKKADWDSVEQTIELFSIGHAQLHELRTLALQFASQTALGWKPSLKRLVGMSWPGLREVEDTIRYDRRGRRVVHTENEAVAYVRSLTLSVSARNLGMYSRAVRSWRGEVVSRS